MYPKKNLWVVFHSSFNLVGLSGYILQDIKTFYCRMLRKQHDIAIIRRSSASDKEGFFLFLRSQILGSSSFAD